MKADTHSQGTKKHNVVNRESRSLVRNILCALRLFKAIVNEVDLFL